MHNTGQGSTDDQCHGQQQLSFFNSRYHGWCFLPMACHVTFDNEFEQYLLAHVLRSGDTHASTGAISIMKRLLKRNRIDVPWGPPEFTLQDNAIVFENTHQVNQLACIIHEGYAIDAVQLHSYEFHGRRTY